MIEHLETLVALYKQGTMAKASTVLRISQSAVSKRVAALEAEYGSKLIERVGRKVRLTQAGLVLVERAQPLIADLREAMSAQPEPEKRKIIFGVSESILSSWGPETLLKSFQKLQMDVEFHCHRSPLVLEKVESGVYDLGLCSGKISGARSIVSEALAPEEMVLVPKARKLDGHILSIEKSSTTWRAIKSQVAASGLKVNRELESYFSIAQLAQAGLGIGLIPIGVAKALGFDKDNIKHLKPKLYRPIQVVFKKSKLEWPYFEKLVKEMTSS